MAKMSAVFAGTLLAYLVVTAVPALALASSCTYDAVDNRLDVVVGTDDRAVLDPGEFDFLATGDYQLLVDGESAANCGVAPGFGIVDNGWVNITGADDGNERVVLYTPAGFTGDNTTIDLGNGTDTAEFAYAETTWRDDFAVVSNLTDISFGDGMVLGSAIGGVLVGDMNDGGAADLRIDDAENIVVGMGFGDDFLDAALDDFGSYTISAQTADDSPGGDIPEGVNPFTQPVTFNGGVDDDWFVSGAGNDTYNGGADVDTVDFGFDTTAFVTVDLALGTATGAATGNDVLTDIQSVWGTEGDDIISGSNIDNELHGREGDDALNGLAGNDLIFAGKGDDTITGGAGDDELYGADDDDLFVEEAAANGSDLVDGDAGYDIVDLSLRTSSLYIEPGAGFLSGQGGCPVAVTCEDDSYDPDNEEYWLGTAADTFEGSGSDEWVLPGAGDDIVDGNGGFDYLDLSDAAGPAVFDLITGTATGNGTDTFEDVDGFSGTEGDDSLVTDGTFGTDYFGFGGYDFFGWGGVDTVDASAASALNDVEIYLDELGTGRDVENAIGGAGDDIIDGNDVANDLMGGDGFDDIFGGLANDTIEGGTGNDLLSGGDGGDTLIYTNSTTGMVIDNQLGFTEGIGGVGDGEDSLAFFEIVKGSDFGDEIWAGQTFLDANNRMLGRGGDDMIVGSNSSDLLKGGAGNDNIRAGGGDDTVSGAAGNDVLFGSGGDDYLKGGKGTDTGNGGRGDDVCKGVEFPKSC